MHFLQHHSSNNHFPLWWLIISSTKSKLVTVLLYLNEDWPHEAGRLCILNNGTDLENYVDEIVPLLGRCLIFKVTDNCWHGHKPLVADRRCH